VVNQLGYADDTRNAAFKAKLTRLMNTDITEANINEFGRFDDLKKCVDKAKAKAYFEALEQASIPPFKLNIKVDKWLKDFIIRGGFDLEPAAGCTQESI
jgi:type I restriction enzyme R subunit